jgi:hypothetical protein
MGSMSKISLIQRERRRGHAAKANMKIQKDVLSKLLINSAGLSQLIMNEKLHLN